MDVGAVTFQLPADFTARCAANKRAVESGEAMTFQNLADALGLPFEFVSAAVAIMTVLQSGRPVIVEPSEAEKVN